MEDNLVTLFTDLSKALLSSSDQSDQSDKCQKSNVNRVRQVAFNLLRSLRYHDIYDPCRDEEGNVWSPENIITDYCYELVRQEAPQASKALWSNVNCFIGNNVSFTEEILTFLLCMKQLYDPNVGDCFRHPLSFTGEDYFFEPHRPFQLVPKAVTAIKPLPQFQENQASKKNDFRLDKFIEKKKSIAFKLWEFRDSPKCSTNDIAQLSFSAREATLVNLKDTNEKQTDDSSPWSALLKHLKQEKIDGLQWDISGRKFVDKYSNDLAEVSNTLKIKSNTHKKKLFHDTSRLALSLYQHEADILNLIDPTSTLHAMRVLSTDEYFRDVVFLLRGVNSSTFIYDDESKIFRLLDGLCLDSVPTDTLQDFSQSFLETGSLFKSLQDACDDGRLCDIGLYGIIFHTFWTSIHNYLQWHSHRISEMSNSYSLMLLKNNVNDLLSTLKTLWKICERRSQLPVGGALLTHIFDQACCAPKQHIRRILVSILSDCTSEYMSKMLQTWIFQGCLDSLWNVDFFVYINVDMLRNRDRSYYLGIMTDMAKVPHFLQSVMERVLACGKAVHLLRMFSPENKFSLYLDAMKYPKLRLCSTEAEFEEFQTTLNKFEQDIFEIKEPYPKADQSTTQEDSEIPQLVLDSTEINKKNDEVLSVQNQVENDFDDCKKRLHDLQFNCQAHTFADEQRMVIEEEMSKMTEANNKLIAEANVARSRAEWRVKRVDNYQKRIDFLERDIANSVLDAEGNIIDTDVADQDNANILKDNVDEAENNNQTNAPLSVSSIENDENLLNIINNEGGGPKNTEIIESPDDNFNVPLKTSDAVYPDTRTLRNELHTSNTVDNNIDVKTCNESEVIQKKLIIEGMLNDSIVESKSGVIMKNPSITHDVECGMGDPSDQMQIYHNNITEAAKNKKKILGTEYDFETPPVKFVTDRKKSVAERNKIKILGLEYNITQNPALEEHVASPMTDAKKNKLKMLASEYGLDIGSVEFKPNTRGMETEAQKNKMKILEPSKPEIHRAKESATLTEAMRNKQKVLGSEYGNNYEDKVVIVPNENKTLTEAQKNKKRMMSTVLDFNEAKEAQNVKETNDIGSNISKQENLNSDEEGKTADSKNEKSEHSFSFFFNAENSDFLSRLDHTVKESKYGMNDEMSPEIMGKQVLSSLEMALSTQERLVNVALFKHYLLEETFFSHIYSLRRYFLLYDGQFSRSLTQGLFESLAKSTRSKHIFSRNTLHTIVNEAINNTSHGSVLTNFSLYFRHLRISLQLKYDASNANHLSFQIVEMPTELNVLAHNVLKPFQLSYKVKWPLNIILTDTALSHYRNIFHFFLSLKRVRWTLNETFALLKSQSKNKSIDGKILMNSPHYTKLAVYRHAMTLFIMTLEEYICMIGPHEAWSSFIKDLESAKNLDDLYLVHVHYVKDILRRCFLVKSSSDLLKYIYTLIELGLKFHHTLKCSTWELVSDQYYEHPLYSSLKEIFNNFCQVSATFSKTLRKRIYHSEMKCHLQLVELIEMKIKLQGSVS